jgi:hypothetical protein
MCSNDVRGCFQATKLRTGRLMHWHISRTFLRDATLNSCSLKIASRCEVESRRSSEEFTCLDGKVMV